MSSRSSVTRLVSQRKMMLAMNQNLVSCLKNTAFNDQGKNLFFIDGVLISGAYTVCFEPHCNDAASPHTAQLYVPSSGVLCSLPQLPDKRDSHTMGSSGHLEQAANHGWEEIFSCLLDSIHWQRNLPHGRWPWPQQWQDNNFDQTWRDLGAWLHT